MCRIKTKGRVYINCFIAVLMIFILMSCGQVDVATNSTSESSSSENILAEVEEKNMEINTPYCIIEIPAEHEGLLKYEIVSLENGCSVDFFCTLNNQSIKLYSLYFGIAEKGTQMGYLNEEGQNIPVSLEVFEETIDDLSVTDKNAYYSVYESVNDVIQAIKQNPKFSESDSDNVINYEEDQTMTVVTEYLELAFPASWSEYVVAEGNANSYTFYCTLNDLKIPLYTIYFNDTEKGTVVGYININNQKIAISTECYDFIPDNTWADKDKNTVYAMGEYINDIVQSIMANENYSAE